MKFKKVAKISIAFRLLALLKFGSSGNAISLNVTSALGAYHIEKLKHFINSLPKNLEFFFKKKFKFNFAAILNL
jgi:hypothetical protein